MFNRPSVVLGGKKSSTWLFSLFCQCFTPCFCTRVFNLLGWFQIIFVLFLFFFNLQDCEKLQSDADVQSGSQTDTLKQP